VIRRAFAVAASWTIVVVAGTADAQLQPATTEAKPVVFVCERGSVKSMIAAQWFNRRAAERGLRVQGVSRGVDPEARIPDWAAAKLQGDGFDLTGVVPVRLIEADVARASRVVAMSTKSPLFEGLAGGPERWDDIPPVSEDYAAARDVIRRHVDALVEELARKQVSP
jgi:protein-tyrosine-phosphatase